MVGGRPSVEASEVPELVKRLYGFNVVCIKELDGYDDKNFLVEWTHCSSHDSTLPLPQNVTECVENPHRFMVKIINKDLCSNPLLLDVKNDITNHVSKSGMEVPRLIKTLSGTYQSTIELTEKKDIHILKLYAFIEGFRLDDVCLNLQLCKELGSCAGLIDKSWMTFPVENYKNIDELTINWNLAEMPEVRKSLHHVKDQNTVPLLEEIISQFESKLLANGHLFSKGLIHSDISDQNSIVSKKNDAAICMKMKEKGHGPCTKCTEDSYTVIGLIDFGDVTYSYHIYELGIVCAYISLNSDEMDRLKAIKAVVEGYVQHIKLSKNEMKHLKVVLCSRLVMSLVYGQVTLALDETNVYTQSHSSRCWPVIQHIWNMDDGEFLDKVGLLDYFNILEEF